MFSKPIDPSEAVPRMEHAEHPRAERAILDRAEAYRLVEEARQMCEERDALAAIVRELAERGPFVDQFNGALEHCADCNANSDWPGLLSDPANHEPSCLWRRAKALYPEPGA